MSQRVTVWSWFLWLVFFPAAAPSAEAPAWKLEWDKTLEAANKEGRLVVYVSDGFELVFAEFEKKHPKIKVVSVTGPGAHISEKAMAERRAGKSLADLHITGVTTLYSLYKAAIYDSIAPLLVLPEILDRSKWWRGNHDYKDDEGKYIFAFNGQPQPHIGYNTKLVDARQIRSYWDILDPNWKGKIIVNDPGSGSGIGGLRFLYYNPGLGPDFVRRFFSEMDITASANIRQLTDWLAVGKYAFSALTTPDRSGLETAKGQGLPVDWFGSKSLKEGIALSVTSGSVAVPKQAPHPNATKLAVNWLLSREGQIAYQRVREGDSLRIDIPKDNLPPGKRRDEGGNYVVAEKPEYMDMKPIKELLAEAWKPKK
jgi:ABC-type Fe3+ transport system substrate-binding protein